MTEETKIIEIRCNTNFLIKLIIATCLYVMYHNKIFDQQEEQKEHEKRVRMFTKQLAEELKAHLNILHDSRKT
jgi:hypothetical protein